MADDDIELLTRANLPDDWTELDTRAVNTVRVLAADAVQKVGNGHPGTAMSLAPLAYTLFQRVMRHDPHDQDWIGRGASADYQTLFREFGFTTEHVVAAGHRSVAKTS